MRIIFFFSFDHLVISILIEFRMVKAHVMLKPMLTFPLAVLPSNQERAVQVYFSYLEAAARAWETSAFLF